MTFDPSFSYRPRPARPRRDAAVGKHIISPGLVARIRPAIRQRHVGKAIGPAGRRDLPRRRRFRCCRASNFTCKHVAAGEIARAVRLKIRHDDLRLLRRPLRRLQCHHDCTGHGGRHVVMRISMRDCRLGLRSRHRNRWLPVRCAGSSGDLPTSSPPAKQTTARQDQARQSSTGDGAGSSRWLASRAGLLPRIARPRGRARVAHRPRFGFFPRAGGHLRELSDG